MPSTLTGTLPKRPPISYGQGVQYQIEKAGDAAKEAKKQVIDAVKDIGAGVKYVGIAVKHIAWALGRVVKGCARVVPTVYYVAKGILRFALSPVIGAVFRPKLTREERQEKKRYKEIADLKNKKNVLQGQIDQIHKKYADDDVEIVKKIRAFEGLKQTPLNQTSLNQLIKKRTELEEKWLNDSNPLRKKIDKIDKKIADIKKGLEMSTVEPANVSQSEPNNVDPQGLDSISASNTSVGSGNSGVDEIDGTLHINLPPGSVPVLPKLPNNSAEPRTRFSSGSNNSMGDPMAPKTNGEPPLREVEVNRVGGVAGAEVGHLTPA